MGKYFIVVVKEKYSHLLQLLAADVYTDQILFAKTLVSVSFAFTRQ